MDLFGRKARAQVASLQVQIAELAKSLNHCDLERDALIKTLRDQDQLIYLMSQCTDWPSMQPHFNKLQSATESRMRLESDHIRDVLIPKVRKSYTETTSKQKAIDHG